MISMKKMVTIKKKENEKINKRLQYEIPNFILRLERTNPKKFRYELANFYGQNYKAKQGSHKKTPPNYNFLTIDAIKSKSYKYFNNPWYILKSKTILNFQIDLRNTGKTKNYIRLIMARFYADHSRRYVFFARFETTSKESLASAFKSQCKQAGINVDYFKFTNDGVYYKTLDGVLIRFIMFHGISGVDAMRFNVFDPSKIDIMVFDEIISKSKKYLKNEVTDFIDVLQTILRLINESNTNIKIILAGNNIDEQSPYHYFFKIPKAFTTGKKGRVVVLKNGDYSFRYTFFSENKKVPEQIKNSLMFNWTMAMNNENYAFTGIAERQNNIYFKKLPNNYDFSFCIYVSDLDEIGINAKLGVFYNREQNKYIVHNKFNPNGRTYIFQISDFAQGEFFENLEKDNFLRAIVENRVNFENDLIKRLVIDAIKTGETLNKYYDI